MEINTMQDAIQDYENYHNLNLSQKEKEYIIKNFIHTCTEILPHMKTGLVDITLLRTDEDYVREINLFSHLSMINNLRQTLLQPIILSYRDNNLYIIDGQHRATACLLNEQRYIPCIIHTNLTKRDEANIMMIENQPAKLEPNTIFKARLTANDPYAKIISDVCKAHNINPYDESFSLSAANRIMSSENAKDCLDWICSITQKIPWATNPQTVYSVMYSLMYIYYDGINHQRITEYQNNLLSVCNICGLNTITMYAATLTTSKDRRNLIKTGLMSIAKGICNKDTIKKFLN